MEDGKTYQVVYYDSLNETDGRIRVRILKCIGKDDTHYKFTNPEKSGMTEGILRTNIVRWEGR